MAKKEEGEESGGKERPSFEFKDKDNYNFVLTQHRVELSRSAIQNGFDERYVSGIFSYHDLVLSTEWSKYADKTEIARLNILRENMVHRLDLPKENGVPKLEGKRTHLELLEWALNLHPDFYHLYPDKEKDACLECGGERTKGKPCLLCGRDERKIMLFYQTAILDIVGVDASEDSLRSKTFVSREG